MKYLKYLVFLVIFSACKVQPQDIEYGVDQCQACKMIISDSRFGCELVTTKGKVFKYDAIECMVPEVLKYGTDHYEFILVGDYSNPGHMINAESAFFRIDPKIPSPMGGNLSAYSDKLNLALSEDSEYLKWTELVTTLTGLERYSRQ